MNVVLISVPHTGTNFTISLFRQHGFRESNLTPTQLEPWTLYHGHMLKGTQVSMARKHAVHMPLVCPLRHPYRVEESWRRQSKDIEHMVECFETMVREFMPLSPYILPVDSPRRDEALRELSEGLELEMTTDWPIVRERVGTHSMTEFTPSQPVRELVDGPMEPLVKHWYGEGLRTTRLS